MSDGAVRIHGLRELNLAFARMGPAVKYELRAALSAVADPVARDAAQLALSDIRNMDQHWARMKVGTRPDLVYVAPYSRRHGGSPRPNLAELLMGRAMQPALDSHQGEIVAMAEAAIDRVTSTF